MEKILKRLIVGNPDRTTSVEPPSFESTKRQGTQPTITERDNRRDSQSYDLNWMCQVAGNGYTYLDLFINNISLWRQPLN